MTTTSEKRANETDDVYYKANVVLVDIEGTTTSIDFVKNTLFPYVRKNLDVYLKSKWNDAEFKEDLKLLQEQSKQDEADGTEGFVKIPEGVSEDIFEDVKKNVLWQMDLDRKTKALKQLQGHIWRDAYKKGEVKAHVYPDVAPALKSWKLSGKDIYVYSSGSVEAQKLLFGHTQDGDLLEIFSGYFDTAVGPKVEESSYSNIVKSVKCKSEEIIFFTDVPKEARAAKSAGLQAVIVVREGNLPITDEDKLEFPVIKSFDDIVFETSVKRRKKSEEETLEQGKANSAVVDVSSMQDVEMQEEPVADKTQTSKAAERVSSTEMVEAAEVQPDSMKQTPVEQCDRIEEANQTSCKDKDNVNNDLSSTKKTGSEVLADKGTVAITEQKKSNETNTDTLEINGAEKLDVNIDNQVETNGPKCPKDSLSKSDANNIDTPIKTNSDNSTNSKDAILNENKNSSSSSEKCPSPSANNLPATGNDTVVPDGKTDIKLADSDKAKLCDKTEMGEHDSNICDDSPHPSGKDGTESLSSDATDSKTMVESVTVKTESTLLNTAELPNKTECTHTEKTENICAKTECATIDNSESSQVSKTESLKPIEAEPVTKKTESEVNKTEPMETDDLTPAHTGDLKNKDESEQKDKEVAQESAPVSGVGTDPSPATDEVKGKAVVPSSETKAPAAVDGGKIEVAMEATETMMEAALDESKAEDVREAIPDDGKAEVTAEATPGSGKAEPTVEATPGSGKAEPTMEATSDGSEAAVKASSDDGNAKVAMEASSDGGKAKVVAQVTTDGGKSDTAVKTMSDDGRDEAAAEVMPDGSKAEAAAEVTPDGGKAKDTAEATSDGKADASVEVTPVDGKAEAAAEATPDAGNGEAAADATPDSAKVEAAVDATPDSAKVEAAVDATPDDGKAETAVEATPEDNMMEAAPNNCNTDSVTEADPAGDKAEVASCVNGGNATKVISDVKANSVSSVTEMKADNKTDVPMEDVEPMVTDDTERMPAEKTEPVIKDESEPMVTDDAESVATDEAKPDTEGAKNSSSDAEHKVTEDPEPMVTEDAEPVVTNKDEAVNSTVKDDGNDKPKATQAERETAAEEESSKRTKDAPIDSTPVVDNANCNSVNKDIAVKEENDPVGTGKLDAVSTAKDDILETKTESSNNENKISEAEGQNVADNVKETENELKEGKQNVNSCVENGESTEKTENTSEKLKVAVESTDKVADNVVST
ncbi:enolase-phosphatase E1 isoform X2 [Schistocerca cancellata]|uniref:enolase-phosphatase E1 isoform X2 n=1 Tax=Schistocerca cancellata TaxID=274614 RepID=UPI0021182FBF|nr:enolase-phosphatase E1 isoform X2 [Schistocerca cancellata]